MKSKSIIASVVSAIILCIVLCSTFIRYGANDCYFLLFPFAVSLGGAGLLALVLSLLRGNISFRFTLADGLITMGVVYYLLRYDYGLHLADWKVIYAALLLLLWYIARVVFSSAWVHERIIMIGFVGIGCVLTGWGLLQLYGFYSSNHFLYRITGPFFNPGPYSGYLAMLLPVCLHQLLSSKGWQRYCWIGAFVLMFSIIPAAMSRSAWLAVLAGLLCVLALHQEWFTACRAFARKSPRKAGVCVVAACILVALSGILLFQLKADSARGRLLIWKNSYTAIAEKPLMGYGPGSFQMVYGKAQAAYFAAGNGTPQEKRVAGYAEFAFNEYLQFGVEGGAILLLFVFAFLIYILNKGVKNGQYGFCGGIVAFAVFSFSSYPLQILPFGMAVIIFSAACVPKDKGCQTKPWNFVAIILSACMCGGSAMSIYKLRGLDELGGQWYDANSLYYSQIYDAASHSYERICPRLNYHRDFLLNYAGSLNAEKRYLEACRILNRAKMVNCDFSIWNTQGGYYQSAGYYRSAEHCFKQSLNLAPERLYPYYLLAKLYLEPNFLNKEKARQMADIVLTKSPKIHSVAVDEMRDEMRKLLSKFME